MGQGHLKLKYASNLVITLKNDHSGQPFEVLPYTTSEEHRSLMTIWNPHPPPGDTPVSEIILHAKKGTGNMKAATQTVQL